MADLSSGLIGLGLLTGTSMADMASSAATIETRAQRRARLQFTTPATTPPWKTSATPPPVRTQVAAITALRSIIDRAAPGGSGPLPADVQTSFTSYKALDRLRILAETAAGTTTGSRDRAALQKTFDRGLADLQSYLGSAPSDLVDLSFGSIVRQVQSVAVAAPASLSATTIAGKGIVAARDAVLPGVAGTETLRIALSTTTSADSILVALDGATTLDAIADRINAAIAAVPRRDAAGAVELDAQGAPVPRWEVRIEPAKTGDRWGLSITRGGFETVAIDQVGAGDALMIARGVATPVTARPPVAPAPAPATPAPVVSVAIGRIDDPAGTMTRRSFATIAAVDTAATERLKFAADADKTGKTKATTIAASVATAAMATDAQGFSYIVGTSAGDLGANRADGADDLLLTKVDSEGAVVWTRMLGTTGSARGAAVTIGPDGGIVVAGTVAGGFDGGTSDGDMLVAKYDAQGDERFATLVRATGPQQAAAVAVASDGTIYVGGQNGSADGEAVITRIDATGRVGERRVIDGSGSVRGLAVAADGALLALTAEAGRAVLRRIDGAALSSDLAQLDLGRGDARALAVAADGSIAVVGAADAALDGVQVNARSGGRDAFVVRVDSALQTAAVTYLGTSAEDQADSVAWLGGAIHVGGRTAGVLDTARTGDVDAFVARIDAATGAIAAVRQFGTAGTRADVVQVSAAPGGNSVLGALGLHRGTLTPTDSVIRSRSAPARSARARRRSHRSRYAPHRAGARRSAARCHRGSCGILHRILCGIRGEQGGEPGEPILGAAAIALALRQQRLDSRCDPDRRIDLGAAARGIGAEPDHLFHVAIGRQDPARGEPDRLLRRRIAMRQRARHRLQDVDRRIAAALGDPAGDDDMPVKDPAHRVGDRFVVIVAIDQHREQSGDRPLALYPRPRAFEQPGQLGEDRRGIALGRGRLAARQPDLALRHREPRDRIHQAQHAQPLVAEMLGDRQRRPCRLAAHQRGLVRCRDDDDAARAAVGPQIVLDEFLHLAAALADQPDHRDVAVGPAREHRQQHRLAHPRSGEQPEPLPLAKRDEQVERVDAGFQLGTDPRAVRGGGRRGADRPSLQSVGQCAASVDRPAEPVDHPPEPGVIGAERDLLRGEHRVRAGGQPLRIAERQAVRDPGVERGDLGIERTARQHDAQPRSDLRRAGQPRHLDQRAADRCDPAITLLDRDIAERGERRGAHPAGGIRRRSRAGRNHAAAACSRPSASAS